MIVLSDSDVVQKLAYCELLQEFLQLLNCPPDELWVLSSLKFRLKRKLISAPTALANFELFLKRTKSIPAAKIETLQRFEVLDVGERQLFAILCDEPRVSALISGDKRALKSVAELASADDALLERLSQLSILCFESILLGLLNARGFSVVSARISRWRLIKGHPVDSVADAAFPKGGSEKLAREILSKYLAKIRNQASFVN